MKLGIDLDGVCYPFTDALKAFAVEIGYDPDTLPAPQGWDFPVDEWGWTWPEFDQVFADGIKAGKIFHEPGPTLACVAALQQLRDDGHEVVIVTHRAVKGAAAEAESATIKWLEHNAVPHDRLIITSEAKVRTVDLMLDDGAHNILAAIEVGEWAVVWDQPWNQPPLVPASVGRVQSWAEFLAVVNEYASGNHA